MQILFVGKYSPQTTVHGRSHSWFYAGLHDAGKTSSLYRMKLGEVVETFPTYGKVPTQRQHHNNYLVL